MKSRNLTMEELNNTSTVHPSETEERTAMGADTTNNLSLVKVVNRMTRDPFLREDLLQEATVHFWTMKRQRPSETLSWYLQSCVFHLRHYLAAGRSVDSLKRRGLRVEMAEEEELFGADSCIIGQVEAREIVHQLSRALSPREQAILQCLAEGLGPREIACRLKFSHPVAIKCRRKIAELAVRMGIGLETSRRPGAGRTNGKVRRKAVPSVVDSIHATSQAPGPEESGPTVAETPDSDLTFGLPSDEAPAAADAPVEKRSMGPLCGVEAHMLKRSY
jgi:RNA polymerase sigma factor (sigma-70 family)